MVIIKQKKVYLSNKIGFENFVFWISYTAEKLYANYYNKKKFFFTQIHKLFSQLLGLKLKIFFNDHDH